MIASALGYIMHLCTCLWLVHYVTSCTIISSEYASLKDAKFTRLIIAKCFIAGHMSWV